MVRKSACKKAVASFLPVFFKNGTDLALGLGTRPAFGR